MSSPPDFEDAQTDADNLWPISLVIIAEQLYKRFEAPRIGWQKVQAKKLVKASTSKGSKKNGEAKETKAKNTEASKKRKLEL